jgi:beta-glucosidase
MKQVIRAALVGLFALVWAAAQADTYYLTGSQGGGFSWNTLTCWTNRAGANPVRIDAADDYYLNKLIVRTPTSANPVFAGHSLYLDQGSLLLKQTDTAVIDNLICNGGNLVAGNAMSTQALHIVNLSLTGYTRLGAAADRSLALQVDTLIGTDTIKTGTATGDTGLYSLSIADASHFSGTIQSLFGTTDFENDVSLPNGTYEILSAGNGVVVLDQDLSVKSLVIDGRTYEPGTWSFAELNADYDALFADGGTGSITVLQDEYYQIVSQKGEGDWDLAGQQADYLLNAMTPEERFSMVCATGLLGIPGVPRLGIPEVFFTDASSGINNRHGVTKGRHPQTIAYPCTLLLAATWDPQRAEEFAHSIGEACRAGGTHMLLGPGMNMYRTSVCGRNWEYFGEDPFLTSCVVEAYVKGIQSAGVAATLKHFIGNEIEFHRRGSNSNIDERTLNEVYMAPFRAGIEAGALAVMTAYNQLNGEWCGQSHYAATDLLRNQLGFKGLIMTDWTSAFDGKKIAASGVNLDNPSGWALKRSQDELLGGEEVDRMVRHILQTCLYAGFYKKPFAKYELLQHRAQWEQTALRVNQEGVVLLKNNGILPLSGAHSKQKILVSGNNADRKELSGGGSGHVEGYDQCSYLEQIRSCFPDADVVHAADPTDEQVRQAGLILLFPGFPMDGEGCEREGVDRSFVLPDDPLISRCVSMNPKTVVCLTAGGGVQMDWSDRAAAVVCALYGGQTGAEALLDILQGRVNPSGKLPFSIEERLEDSPGYNATKPEANMVRSYFADEIPSKLHKDFFCSPDKTELYTVDVNYDEGIFCGYRWYEAQKKPVRFPFGFGLSYTTFEFRNAQVSSPVLSGGQPLTVTVEVCNTGDVAGAEVVQCYVHDQKASVPRPWRELKAFQKVMLEPGETKTVSMVLDAADFSFWDIRTSEWMLEPGAFELLIGNSSRDVQQTVTIEVSPPADRPNILWLTSEDNNVDWVGCYGNPYAETPHIDQLAKEGFQYMHAYANAPVCAPSRSTWITGILAISAGTFPMRSRNEIPHDRIQYYPDFLQANGYFCGNDRKTDYNIGGRIDRKCWNNFNTVDWEKLKNKQPFFQVINSMTSHESRAQGGVRDIKHDPADVRLRTYHPDLPFVRRTYCKYHDAVTRMDAEIGSSLQKLDEMGLAENTIVIYCSDHGGVMPGSKRYIFQSGIHSPLIVRIPERFKNLWPAQQPGAKIDRLVSFVDMPKTWLSLTGSEVPSYMQGRIFLGPKTEPEPEVHFSFRGRMDERIDNARAISTKRFLYIRNYMPYVPWMQYLQYLWEMKATQAWDEHVKSGKATEVQARFFKPKGWTEELYDMQNDPDNVDNLIENPNYAQVADKLRKALRQQQIKFYDAGLIPESEMVKRAADNNLTIYDMVRNPNLYNVSALLDAADLALEKKKANLPSLGKLMGNPDPGIRYWGMVGGFLLNDQKLGFQGLEDDSHEVRAMAAWTLINTGEEQTGFDCLVNLLQQNSYAALTVLNMADWMGDDGQDLMPAVRAMTPKDKSDEQRVRDFLIRKFDSNLLPESEGPH